MNNFYSALPPLFRGRKAPQYGPPEKSGKVEAYRAALRTWWTLTAAGLAADPTLIDSTHRDILRLIAEVGEPEATRLRATWGVEWFRETGVCPLCGEPGTCHVEGA